MKHRKHSVVQRAAAAGKGTSAPVASPAAQPLIVQAINLQNAGKPREAEALFLEVLATDPDNAAALYSLVVLLMADVRRHDEALRIAEHGVACAASYAPMWLAHASVLQAVGRKEEALASYDKAVAVKPDYTEALINGGVLARDLYRHRDALERFNQILTYNPNHPSALANCGILLTEFKRNAEAIRMFERLMTIAPDYDYLPGLLNYERLHACDWTDFGPLVDQILTGVRAGKRSSKTLGLMAISDDASDHFLAARIFAQHWFGQTHPPLWTGERYGHQRLRIAYISPDLREHPVGHLMAGIFERHDKTRFETYAVSLGIDDGSRLRQRMLAAFDHFLDARPMTPAQIAAWLRVNEIDVAIDLAGYTSDSRPQIFAHRPAPVQVTYLGYPGTLGTAHFDYILADRHVIPEEHQPFYTEKVAYLPHTYLPTDASIQIAERTPTRAECGLPETGAVLCSFSHDYKIHPDLFAMWMRILGKTPGSVLWLVSRNEYTQANLRKAAQAQGVAADRLIFASRVPRVEDHLARYRLADLFLDTWPYNAHTTAADALMAGLPVVSMMGNAFPARVAGSLLHAIGLPEMIAASAEAYEELAVALVSDSDRLEAIKAKLARNRATHPLFDTARFCRDLEDVLLGLAPAEVAPPVEADSLRAELDAARGWLVKGNPPQAELHARHYLRAGGDAASAQQVLDSVAHAYGLPPNFRLTEVAAPIPGRYLLIKAWGYGFWSDVHHVLGQLLVAELTGRTPVVHWGANSLFGDGSGGDAFGHYFEPVSTVNLASLPLDDDVAIYPPKWRRDNLHSENLNKWSGDGSRLAAQYVFARSEPLVVSDFYSTVSSLQPWIAADSAYHGQGENDIYARLFAKYLRPQPHIVAKVEAFHAAHLAGRNWVAVHVRGSDKVLESAGLHRTNAQYVEFIDRIIGLNPGIGVFLMTDAHDLQLHYTARYGDRLVTTSALRSNSQAGVHLQGHDGRQVGEEVLVDALLAARCDYFVGNQESNVSLAVASLKPWRQGVLVMLGDKNCRSDNFFLHQVAVSEAVPASPPVVPPPQPVPTTPVQVDACRLCAAPVRHAFDMDVLGRHRVGYHLCSGCGSLQTELPHWLDEAYSGAAERFDTGKASRTLVNVHTLPSLLDALGVKTSDVAVDFGGGTGLFARLMRDRGYNFHTHDKFGSSEFMGGYVWEALDRPAKLVTLFEVAEHFADPAAEWARIFAVDPDWVIGSTGIYTGQGADWPYLTAESGQHVFFYTLAALAHLASRHGRSAYHLGSVFLITRQPLDAATQARIATWRGELPTVCKASFEAWMQGPYTHAGADHSDMLALARLRQSGRRIAVDGVFFRYATGVSRVWRTLLACWSASDFAESVVVIDRVRTAPRLPGFTYVDVPDTDFASPEVDGAMLQAVCDANDVALFISTYYSAPTRTPTAMLVYDMIPEVFGHDMSGPQWVAKTQALAQAQMYLSISHSTDRDLLRFVPKAQALPRAITHCGCDFRTASESQVAAFKARFGIQRPYFLVCGTRAGPKNVELFFKAFALLGEARSEYAVVCTNANQQIEPELAAHLGGAALHLVVLSNAELQCAYSGAIALAYPSRYEGFGLPVLEAMACSCPVITCANSSLIEVGGEAVRYVDPDSVTQMRQAIADVQQPAVRADLIRRGLQQAAGFSWTRMAREVGRHLASWAISVP